MLHRHTEVKFRDNQENRVQQFPKTPKNANNVLSSKFVTPAPKPRIALGAKSTNVHHRQFSSAKTGKRHSPVTASKEIPVIAPEEAKKLKGGAALRAALNQALLTGVDIPEVEYAPPPVEELPYEEPEWMTPMDWGAFDAMSKREPCIAPQLESYRNRLPRLDNTMPKFEFMETELKSISDRKSKAGGTTVEKASLPASRKTATSKLGGFAAPTAAAQAKMKAPVRKETAASRKLGTTKHPVSSSTSRPRSKASVSKSPSILDLPISTTPLPGLTDDELFGPIDLPDPDPLPDFEVEFDCD